MTSRLATVVGAPAEAEWLSCGDLKMAGHWYIVAHLCLGVGIVIHTIHISIILNGIA